MANKSSCLIGLSLCLILIHQTSFALQATCFPSVTDVPESANWPVCVIYLHGLHPSNDEGTYTKYEKRNRPIVEEFKQQYLNGQKCRIAAPVAPDGRWVRNGNGKPFYVHTKYRDWQHRSLETIEAAAKNACGGPDVKLAPKRALLGFSAGGWSAFKLAENGKDCKAVSEYSMIVGIGLPELRRRSVRPDNTVPGACSNLRIFRTHDFAGQFANNSDLKQKIAAAVSVPVYTQTAELQTGRAMR